MLLFTFAADLIDNVNSAVKTTTIALKKRGNDTFTDIYSDARQKKLSSVKESFDDQLQTFFQEHIDPLFGRGKIAQLARGDDQRLMEISEPEKEINRYLPWTAAALGLSIAGTVFPPLLLGALGIGLTYTAWVLQMGYDTWKEERRVTVIHMVGLYCAGVWLGGFYLAGSIGMLLHAIGEKMALISQDRSQKELVNVFGQQPRQVWVLLDGIELNIPFEQLQKGDILIVHAGETVPSDGVIVKGQALVDQHKLTGEAQPVEKTVDDAVLAATVVLAGTIQVEVEKAGSETLVAQIGEILNATAEHRTVLAAEALEISNKTIYPTLALSAISVPLLGLQGAMALLGSNHIINLSIVGPMSMLNFLKIALDQGILIKDGRSLERLNAIDTVVFDKTGTLTEEVPTVTQIYTYTTRSETEVLTLAAAAEYHQSHPLAQAILAAAHAQELAVPPIGEAYYEAGYGMKVQISEQQVYVGSYRFMEMAGLAIPATLATHQADCQAQGHSLVLVGVDSTVVGAIELAPALRSEAQEVINKLLTRGLSLYILSGDQEEPTRHLAHQLGIKDYFANTLPQQKAELIEQLQQQGRTVCFVGDGINDALALKRADVSISLRGATTAATDTAHIVLMDGTLKQLPQLFTIAKELKQSDHKNLKVMLGSSLVCGLGVIFFHFGIIVAEILFSLSLAAGLGLATKPLLEHQARSATENSTKSETKGVKS